VSAGTGIAQAATSTGDAVTASVVFVVLASDTIAGPVLYALVGGQRARDWKKFLNRTGLNQADLIRDALDERMKAAHGGLPSVAAKWAGKVKGSGVTATNAAVAKALGR
jgi:hypothetical protein